MVNQASNDLCLYASATTILAGVENRTPCFCGLRRHFTKKLIEISVSRRNGVINYAILELLKYFIAAD